MSNPGGSNPEVLIIGAGCAGIAAARALRDAGRSCVVLEASPRAGGRARTVDAWGEPLDLGATWLHAAERNPLTPHAGECQDHDAVRDRHMLLRGDGRREEGWASAAQLAAYAARLDETEAAIAAALATVPPDRPVADVTPRGARWDATIAHWLGAQINAAELCRIGIEDYVRTDLDGANLLPKGGVGATVERLARGLPIAFDSRVETLRWGGAEVVAEGEFGSLRARSAIVTVSTGVLAAGGLRFAPELPAATLAAVEALPMGLLSKLAFRAASDDRFGLGAFHSARMEVREGSPPPFGWIFWPFARAHLYGFVGGERAWALSREGPAAFEAAARDDLRAMFGGSRADAAVGEAILSDWGADPLCRGAYTHARPGGHAMRAKLAEPLAGGRLLFAGEACHSRFAGTVAGAWLSGEAAAALTR